MASIQRIFGELGLVFIERGWLSSNSVVFPGHGASPATVVDTGYGAHSAQTVGLLSHRMAGGVGRVVNTHLHSDHCGGNARLQHAFGAEVWVPATSFDAARHWDMERLSFERTDQRCERFVPHVALEAGADIPLGGCQWVALAAPGHDPDALMLFQPESRVLISGDALWSERLAIIFPELEGCAGFDETERALAQIEALAPSVVIPGHGVPFTDVSAALAASRRRLAQFRQMPQRHREYAARALSMFRMLELRHCSRESLESWLTETPIFQRMHEASGTDRAERRQFAGDTVTRLVTLGQLSEREGQLELSAVETSP